MVGGLIFGSLSDRWGRKPFILLTMYLHIIVGTALAFVHNYTLFVLLRFAQGILMQVSFYFCLFICFHIFTLGMPPALMGIVIQPVDGYCHQLVSLSVCLSVHLSWHYQDFRYSLIARFMGPTWGPSWADRTQVGPMLAPWILLSGLVWKLVDWYLVRVADCFLTHCGPMTPYGIIELGQQWFG